MSSLAQADPIIESTHAKTEWMDLVPGWAVDPSVEDIREQQRQDVDRATEKHGVDIEAISEELWLHPMCVKWRLVELGYIERAERVVKKPLPRSDTAKRIALALSNGGLTLPQLAARLGLNAAHLKRCLLRNPRLFCRNNLCLGKVYWVNKPKESSYA